MAEIEEHDEIEDHEKVDQEKADEHLVRTEPKKHLLLHLQKENKPNVDA
jgi:hypothetical protein